MLLTAEMDLKPHQGSAEFERTKALVGDWEASMPIEKGKEHPEMSEEHKQMMQKMRVSNRVTAGGSAILETTAAGTPMEMISMYHDRGGVRRLVNKERLETRSCRKTPVHFFEGCEIVHST